VFGRQHEERTHSLPTCNQEHHCRGKCRAGAGIDALTTSPVGLTVERGVDGAPATLNLRNVPYFLLRALNQVDAAQHRASAATTHGQWATAESAADPATSASSAQVEALLQDAANMLTVDAASWTQKTDRIHLSRALADRLRDVLQANVSDTKAFQALSLV